jgi:Uma2 family endonuclease
MRQIATVEEFIAWEETQEQKYEFCDGKISLFPGGALAHGVIIANIVYELRKRGMSASNVIPSEVKVVTDRASRYPDVSVLGDVRDTDMRATFVRHPRAIFEVLSPSTHRIDRGIKAENYLAIEELVDYVLVDSRKRWAQAYSRSGGGWQPPITSGDLYVPGLGVTIAFDELYAGTDL